MMKGNTFLLMGLTIVLLLFSYAVDFNGLYGADGYEYLEYSKKLKVYISGGESPGSFRWPPLYPIIGALFSFLVDPIFALQLVSILAFAGTLIYCVRLISHIYGYHRIAVVYVLLFGVLSPYFLRLGLCIMSDMMSIFFCTAAIFHTLQYRASGKRKDLIWVFPFSLMAVFTRYVSVLALLIPLAVLGIGMMKKSKLLLAGCVVALVIAGSVVHILYPEFFLHAIRHDLFRHWTFENYFLSSFNYEDGIQAYKQPNIIFILFLFLHPGFIVLSPAWLFFLRPKEWTRENVLFILLPVLLYVIFLAGIPNQNTRLLSFVFPFALVLLFQPFLLFYEKWITNKSKKIIFHSLVLLSQFVLFVLAFDGIGKLNKSDRIRAMLVKENAGNHSVYTFVTENSLKAYGVTSKIIPLWEKEITAIESEALLLVNKAEITLQPENPLTRKNWERIKAIADLAHPVCGEGEWILFWIGKRTGG